MVALETRESQADIAVTETKESEADPRSQERQRLHAIE